MILSVWTATGRTKLSPIGNHCRTVLSQAFNGSLMGNGGNLKIHFPSSFLGLNRRTRISTPARKR